MYTFILLYSFIWIGSCDPVCCVDVDEWIMNVSMNGREMHGYSTWIHHTNIHTNKYCINVFIFRSTPEHLNAEWMWMRGSKEGGEAWSRSTCLFGFRFHARFHPTHADCDNTSMRLCTPDGSRKMPNTPRSADGGAIDSTSTTTGLSSTGSEWVT